MFLVGFRSRPLVLRLPLASDVDILRFRRDDSDGVYDTAYHTWPDCPWSRNLTLVSLTIIPGYEMFLLTQRNTMYDGIRTAKVLRQANTATIDRVSMPQRSTLSGLDEYRFESCDLLKTHTGFVIGNAIAS